MIGSFHSLRVETPFDDPALKAVMEVLTEKQVLFVRLYIQEKGSMHLTAQRCGIKPNAAYRMWARIQKRLRQRRISQ